jgi:hypothetical protein
MKTATRHRPDRRKKSQRPPAVRQPSRRERAVASAASSMGLYVLDYAGRQEVFSTATGLHVATYWPRTGRFSTPGRNGHRQVADIFAALRLAKRFLTSRASSDGTMLQ